MTNKRRGFTVMELIVVLAIAAVMLAVAGPRWASFRQGSNMRSAKQTLASSLVQARQTAMQRGQPTRLIATGTTLDIERRQPNGAWVDIMGAVELHDQFQVTLLGGGTDTITFDSRGFPHVKAKTTYPMALGTRQDTVCVEAMGIIKTTGCTP